MSASAEIALRKAVRACLGADAALAALVGARIYDGAPRTASMPYVTGGDARLRDWSTASDHGAEHLLTLEVWSAQPGAREALAIADLVSRLLDGAALTLDDHRLIDLRFVSLETRRDGNGRFARASLRLRAITERL